MIIPVLHRLLVKPDTVETVTNSGIVLAINEKREQAAAEQGVVISKGETCFADYGGRTDTVVVGDRVLYAKYAGKEVTDLDGTKYILVNDEDIVGVIK
jgi:co-chaperonin GroES (HSP10)